MLSSGIGEHLPTSVKTYVAVTALVTTAAQIKPPNIEFYLHIFYFSPPGAIECYCNRPECSKTHICLSHLEQCYSKFNTVYTKQKNDSSSSRESDDEHGCVDMVNTRDSTMCEGRGVVVKAITAQESLIMCCSDNMCNYKEKQDRPIVQVDIMDTVKSKSGKATIPHLENICPILHTTSK